MNTDKKNFLNMNRRIMREFFTYLGEKPFRANQVMKWIYHYYCDDFNQMTDINKYLRLKLNKIAEIRAPEVTEKQLSLDGTIKWMMQVGNQKIETVYIPEDKRGTLCISSQVGCALNCKFCATAQQGFNRNLRIYEIIGQLWRASKIISINNKKIDKEYARQHPITNVVMMGMGEPLLNLTNVVPAIEIMLDNLGFGLSKRHITISTVGIVPALDKLGDKLLDIGLAISLHAPNDNIRNEIVPINRKYNIDNILSAIRRYLAKSKTATSKVTVEYVMLDHINDGINHAHELAKCLKNTPCKINLIPFNKFNGTYYRCSSNNSIDLFANILIDYGFITTVRKTRGNDINAACGQLTGKIIDRTKR